MSAIEKVLDKLSELRCAPRRNGAGWMARCPAHEDRNPSLGITPADSFAGVLLRCYAGCDTEAILAGLAMTKGDLFDSPRDRANGYTVVRDYRYCDESGRLLFCVERRHPKDFRPRRPDGSYGLKGVRLVPYRLPDVVATAKTHGTVYVCEGEKDADALAALGLVSTTNQGGAKNWRDAYAGYLHGANVVVIADKDEPGRAWAARVARSLAGVAASVRVVEALVGKDVSDHLAAGHGVEELVPLDLRNGHHGEPVPEPEQAPDENTAIFTERLVPGGTFVLDCPTDTPAIWGAGHDVLWERGESLLIAAAPGLGKTTLAGQLVRCRLGLSGTLLGLPVQPGRRRVLYLAMDRPQQVARSLRRIFTDEDRAVLDELLVVWKGPPAVDIGRHPESLLGLVQKCDADTLVVDSLKDAAIGLTDDTVAAGLHRARQYVLEQAGCEVLELHHNVKRNAAGGDPTSIADVYGSAFITAGVGSVLLLTGAAGDPIVGLRHLKQPADEVGPWRLIHDTANGTTCVHHSVDLVSMATRSGGITVRMAAAAMFEEERPSLAQIEKARRRLESLVRSGHLAYVGIDDVRHYVAVELFREGPT